MGGVFGNNGSVIYHVLVDRFNGVPPGIPNTNHFMGGNLKGVTQKLDYIKDLGADVVWLSPFYESDQFHGYHITDFKKVSKHFGTLDDFLELMASAKKRGLKVIADYVPNHCSYKHPFFQDVFHNASSPYKDWFIFKNWPDEYLCFLHYKELPKINLDFKPARDYMIDVADYWMSLGLDGFRIDHVLGPSQKFWRAFKRNIVSKYPDAVFIGEAWGFDIQSRDYPTLGVKHKWIKKLFGISQRKLQLEYKGKLTGVLDFYLNSLIINAVKKGEGLLNNPSLALQVKNHLKKLPKGYSMVAFLDNHDMDRFLSYCDGNMEVLLEAFELLLSLPLPVAIYYGTETGVYNKTPLLVTELHSDLKVREPFDWEHIDPTFIEGFKALVQKYRR